MKNHSIYKQKISYICTPTNLQAHGRHLHPYSLLQDTLHLLRFLLHHPQRTEKPLYPCVVQGVADAERISEGRASRNDLLRWWNPSQLAEEDFREVFETIRKYYGMEHCREITLEANPDDLTEAYAAMLQNLPFNRISMGIQTFDDSTLKLLNRRHNAAQAVNAVKHCRHAGFNNISIDLIYGLPGETDERWKRDLQQAVSLNVEHISAYHLTYEEAHSHLRAAASAPYPRSRRRKQRPILLHPDRYAWQCRLRALRDIQFLPFGHVFPPQYILLERNSLLGLWPFGTFIQYGYPRMECGFPEKYIHAIENNQRLSEQEHLDRTTCYNECIMTSIRTRWGVPLNDIEQKFGKELWQYCFDMARPHLDCGNLEIYDNNRLCLSRKGIFVSDGIISDLMFVEE